MNFIKNTLALTRTLATNFTQSLLATNFTQSYAANGKFIVDLISLYFVIGINSYQSVVCGETAKMYDSFRITNFFTF